VGASGPNQQGYSAQRGDFRQRCDPVRCSALCAFPREDGTSRYPYGGASYPIFPTDQVHLVVTSLVGGRGTPELSPWRFARGFAVLFHQGATPFCIPCWRFVEAVYPGPGFGMLYVATLSDRPR
jgi:hypothetical protein